MNIRRIIRWIRCLVIVFILLGLAVAALIIAVLSGDDVPIILADCIEEKFAWAWIDANENGNWDRGEQRLSGVEFIMDDVLNDLTDVGGRAVSDNNGRTLLTVWLPGCPDVHFEVYALPTEGYRFTTPQGVLQPEASLAEPSMKSGFIRAPQQ
ncbi:MAG: hypothetical protein R3300_07830 [Candidatus Promineifilaceae bacterium]|nr:hypothetical protein [Candidatus Promineifilaceae bacterium]